MRVSAAFDKLADLAFALNAHPLNKHAGCWEHRIDEHWSVAVNAHREERKNASGDAVPPFSAALEFNGWPAGLLYPDGGWIAAGVLANEEEFIAAVERAIGVAKREGR